MGNIIEDVLQKTSGQRVYYFGTVGSDKIKSITFVPVTETSRRKTPLVESTDEGYQRPGSLSRMRAFAKYLREHPNNVVPPVVLSSRDAWVFSGSNGGLGRLEINGPAAVVDGQHRLGGYVTLFEDDEDVREVSFIVLPGLTVDEELGEFLDVNTTQKGVPKPLTAYLEDTPEAQVAWGLNQEPDSPFRGRITRTSMQRQHLFALHSVAKQVGRLFGLGALQDLDVAAKTDYMSRFWVIVADAKPDEWSDVERLDDPEFRGRRDFDFKMLELTGLIAWSHCGAHILARSYSETSGMNLENVRRLVEYAGGVDWRKKAGQYEGRTGEAGGRVIADDMQRLLPPETTPMEEEGDG